MGVLAMRARTSEPGLWVDVVDLRRADQGVHEGGAIAAAVGAGEEPGLSSEGHPAQRSAALLVRQMRPSSRNGAKRCHLVSM